MGNVRLIPSAGGCVASSCWRTSVREVDVSLLRPDPGFGQGRCLEVEGIIVYALIGREKAKSIMK